MSTILIKNATLINEGSQKVQDVFIVDQPNEELASTITGTNILCNGDTTGTIDLTINGGTTPYTVQWNNGSIDQDQTDLGAGDYDVIITEHKKRLFFGLLKEFQCSL